MGKRYTYLNVYEHSGGQAGINFYSFLATTIPVRCDAPCVRKRQRPLSASRFSTPLIIRIIIFLIFVVVIGDSSALVGIWPKIYRVAAITPIMFPWTTPFPSLAGRCCRLSIWSSARTLPPSLVSLSLLAILPFDLRVSFGPDEEGGTERGGGGNGSRESVQSPVCHSPPSPAVSIVV